MLKQPFVCSSCHFIITAKETACMICAQFKVESQNIGHMKKTRGSNGEHI